MRVPDSPPEFANYPLFQWGFKVDGEGIIITSEGSVQLAEITYSSIIYDCGILEPGLYISSAIDCTHYPNNNLKFEHHTWGLNIHGPYKCWQAYYDYDEGKIYITTYDEYGNIINSYEK